MAAMSLAPDDPRHGKRMTYQRLGCRCDACCRAHTEYQWESRMMRLDRPMASDDPRHGKATTYTNWGCRCQACKAANTTACAARKARRKGAQRR